jgi:anthranilate phosphoribosyltransferase
VAVLSGAKCPARDLVLANTAAALLLAGRVSRLTDGVRIAAETVDSGKALDLLQALQRSHPSTQ